MATSSAKTGEIQRVDTPVSKPLPTVLLIPGAFAHVHMFDGIITGLRNQGYEVYAYDILTASRRPGQRPATLHEDVAFFSGVLTILCDLGKDVVVLGHSYAGCVLTECVRGLTSKRERNGCQGEGRVVGMVYLAAFAPKVGESVTRITDEAALQFESVGADGPFLYHYDHLASARMSFSDLPEAEGVAWAKRFRYQSYLAFKNETEYAGYEDVDKVVFIVTTEDIPLPPRVQMSMVDTVRKARKWGDVGVYEVKAGHGAPFTRPELLVPVILDVLRKEF